MSQSEEHVRSTEESIQIQKQRVKEAKEEAEVAVTDALNATANVLDATADALDATANALDAATETATSSQSSHIPPTQASIPLSAPSQGEDEDDEDDDDESKDVTMEMNDDLTKPVPTQGMVFCAMGGTRAFIIRAGPGRRSDVERLQGFVSGVSDAPDDLSEMNGRRQAERLAQGMRETVYASMSKFFTKHNIKYGVSKPRLYHDGSVKSKKTHAYFLSMFSAPIEDRMTDTIKPKDLSFLKWIDQDGFRNTNPKVLEPIIIIAGLVTMERLFGKAKMNIGKGYNLGPVAGSVSVIDYPVKGSREKPMIHMLMGDKFSLALAGVWANASGTPSGGMGGTDNANNKARVVTSM